MINIDSRRNSWSNVLPACLMAFAGVAWSHAQCTFNIEIDYMVGTSHSHEPDADAIAAVVQMFACQGHTLNIVVDDALPHFDVIARDPDDCSASIFDYDGAANSFGALLANFDHADDSDWHYCIFAHDYEDEDCNASSSSGIARLNGRYLIVSLGSFSGATGTRFDQAATLAHEFGHNLGLTHSGDSDDSVLGEYNPILPSVMSYRYQLAGVRTMMTCAQLPLAPGESRFRELDYSHGTLCTDHEKHLNELDGTFMTAVDWNCDGTLDVEVSQDISNDINSGYWCGNTGTQSSISDQNEWSRVYSYCNNPQPQPLRDMSCITHAEWQSVQREIGSRGGCFAPLLEVEDCIGENVFLGEFNAVATGTCNNPHVFVSTAHNSAPSNSTFFFKPGTYTHPGPLLLDKPGYWLCPTGQAIVLVEP